ncbi:hypothetical protein RND71_037375 [Anisodus tanguticus]|uniref:Histidine-containing phosphotransfer protein n=1 Tax=Anisodus tanguticus TaxID=243964 RepID=A0AAE1R399_9SOLA|nr:hypothetical protein RND71_037375 [Anisodus tanguticus]
MASDFARYIANLRQSLFDEQILDGRFVQLELLENDSEGFLEDACAEYFRDAAKILGLMVAELERPPYHIPTVESLFSRFKRSTTSVILFLYWLVTESALCACSIGAAKVTHQINCMKQNWKGGDFRACMIAFEIIKRENEHLQFRLENYLKLRKQGPPVEIEDRPEYGYIDSDSE